MLIHTVLLRGNLYIEQLANGTPEKKFPGHYVYFLGSILNPDMTHHAKKNLSISSRILKFGSIILAVQMFTL